jgi:CheY-like chemotaxis protein
MPIGGLITIETGTKPQTVFISIGDNGIGMNEETRSRMFQPFFSTKGYGIGRGLGMSGAYATIKEHGGNIDIKNTKPGKGTIIEITLPFPQITKKIMGAVPVNQEPDKDLDNKRVVRILWVDDEPAINMIVHEMVKMLGHRIDIANSAKEALALFDQNQYDLLITDIGMPGMDGWQLADIIKERNRDNMKVAVSSGWGTQVTESDKLKHGVNFKMDKPFSIEQLKKLIREIEKDL